MRGSKGEGRSLKGEGRSLKGDCRSPKGDCRSPKVNGQRQQGERPQRCDFADEESAFWSWGESPPDPWVIREEPAASDNGVRDLEERAARFAEAVIRFAKKVPGGPVTNRLIDQLVGAGTSLAANYAEAQDAVSRRDFRNRVGTSRKESKETMFFLRMIAVAVEPLAGEARALWREARELNRIFGAIWRRCA